MSERDNNIDFLRFLGLSLIILAHVQAPFTLTQLRCFDVPLMFFLSGLTASGKIVQSYQKYLIKRIKRLVIPVWIFLAFYISSLYLIQFFILPEQYLTWTMIWRSFLFLDESIGYVWIIRVFLLIMFITPPCIILNERVKNIWCFLLIELLLLGFTQCLFFVTSNANGGLQVFIRDFLLYTVAYSMPFYLGLRLMYLDARSERRIMFFLIGFYVIMLVYHLLYYGFPIGISSEYKVPPRSYYLVYGCMMSSILWYSRKKWCKLANLRLASWIGRNTIWIYLWHMPFALFLNGISIHWGLRFIIMYGGALAFFYLQYYFVNKSNTIVIKQYLLG